MNAFFKKSGWRGILQAALVVLLGALFIFAGWSKLQDLPAFTKDIGNYRILPEAWAPYLAAWLPWLEVLTGIAILVRPLRLTGTLLTCLLMGVFTIAVGAALARGLDISCGCFGKAFGAYAEPVGIALLRDILLLAASVVLLRLVWVSEERDMSK